MSLQLYLQPEVNNNAAADSDCRTTRLSLRALHTCLHTYIPYTHTGTYTHAYTCTQISYIPVIDFGPFLHGTEEQKKAVADEVVHAFR